MTIKKVNRTLVNSLFHANKIIVRRDGKIVDNLPLPACHLTSFKVSSARQAFGAMTHMAYTRNVSGKNTVEAYDSKGELIASADFIPAGKGHKIVIKNVGKKYAKLPEK
jgi:hypothetical protein